MQTQSRAGMYCTNCRIQVSSCSFGCMLEWSLRHLVVHASLVLWGIFSLTQPLDGKGSHSARQAVGVPRQVGHCLSFSSCLHCTDGRTGWVLHLRFQGLWAKVFSVIGLVLVAGDVPWGSLSTRDLWVMVLLASVSGSLPGMHLQTGLSSVKDFSHWSYCSAASSAVSSGESNPELSVSQQGLL